MAMEVLLSLDNGFDNFQNIIWINPFGPQPQ
jgi:hypothetical protein